MNETPQNNLDQLKLLAKKLQSNDEFMASLLANYQQKEHLSDNQMIAHLKTTQAMFVRLAFCKRPKSASALFAAQVRQISVYTNIDPSLLANVIRHVESIDKLKQFTAQEVKQPGDMRKRIPGLLAAARDTDEVANSKEDKADQNPQDDKGEDDVA